MALSFSFDGPLRNEDAETFSDFRLDVVFKHRATGDTVQVPGYFAAGGDAESASGSVWQAHFNPPRSGAWDYEVRFRTGDDIAASTSAMAGQSAGAMDGQKGSITVSSAQVANTIEYDGDHFASSKSGDPYLKFGSGSPENLLSYDGFDGTPKASKTWDPHRADWNAGDPTWSGGRGKEIIGAFNYLAEQGVTSQYIVLNTAGGDGQDAWPWVSPKFGELPKTKGAVLPGSSNRADLEDARVYDVSKLAQWAIALEHADDVGITSHLFFDEVENANLLNNGNMGVERAIYYREMIARLGHLDKINWTIGEETPLSTAQLQAAAAYIKAIDPYDHLLTVHTFPIEFDRYKGLLGDPNIDGMSMQAGSRDYELSNGFQDASDAVAYWKQASANAGRPWVIFWDETTPAKDGVLPDDSGASAAKFDLNHRAIRGEAYQSLFAGASGFEWFFGYQHPQSDIAANSFENRATLWEWNKALRDFAELLPLDRMSSANALVRGDDVASSKAGEIYAIYTQDGGAVSLNLSGAPGTYSVRWYDPRNGGFKGEVGAVEGGKTVNLGSPPNNTTKDWLVVVEKSGGGVIAPDESDVTPGGPSVSLFGQQLWALDADDRVVSLVTQSGRTGVEDDEIDAGPGDQVHVLLSRPADKVSIATDALAVSGAWSEGIRVLTWGEDAVFLGERVLLASDAVSTASGGYAFDVDFGADIVEMRLSATDWLGGSGAAPKGAPDFSLLGLSVSAGGGGTGGGGQPEGLRAFGVTLSGQTAAGADADVDFTNGVYGVRGEQSNLAIDYNKAVASGEKMIVTFDQAVDQAGLSFQRLAFKKGWHESFQFRAFDADGAEIASGRHTSRDASFATSSEHEFRFDCARDIKSIVIEADDWDLGSRSKPSSSSDLSLIDIDFLI